MLANRILGVIVSTSGAASKELHGLLGVIGRIGKDAWMESPIQAIVARNNNAMLVCIHKIIIEQNLPLSMHQFTVTMRHKCDIGSFATNALSGEIFERIWKLNAGAFIIPPS
jgi:hypothetical protein